MWFGDLVTMKWFNDVWMKEVFANFMAAKIVNPSFPDVNHELRFLLGLLPAGLRRRSDRRQRTRSASRSTNLDEAGTLYGAIIYQKAPIVMRQLETLVGPDGFRDGLRDYLKAHAFGNATWPDLIALLDSRTPEDLAAWSQRLGRGARPADHQDRVVAGGRQDPAPRLHAARSVSEARPGLEPALQGGDRRPPGDARPGAVERGEGRGPRRPRTAGVGSCCPTAGASATARFISTPPASGGCTANLPTIDDELTRGSAWVTLYDAMLDGEVAPDAFLSLALRALPLEKNELNVSRILVVPARGLLALPAGGGADAGRAARGADAARSGWTERPRRA